MSEKGLKFHGIFLGIIGSPEFCRRYQAAIKGIDPSIPTFTASLTQAWASILEHKPNLIVFEIGFRYSNLHHQQLRKTLEQVRARFKDKVYTAVALMNSEQFYYGGDLLFRSEESLEPSEFVDTLIAAPPSNVPGVPDIPAQLQNVLYLYQNELKRRADGLRAVPPLGSAHWAQSLADPLSRELWMKWLPRYASYTTENPLILGDTGTGKTKLAYALHHLSARKGKFISITPRDFSSSELVQVELFGAVAGAYTGAVDKWGLVKAAEGGTLFIDELQSIDKELQGKLITFIENKVYRRVGSAESIEADVRFIFASNRPLYEMMESDTLRDDFGYRLERMQLDLRSLESRPLDISAALAYALAKVPRQRPLRRPILGTSSEAYRMLFGHHWPGNLRQLENKVAQLCEIADMNELTLIDEQTVQEGFQSKLSGRIRDTSDIVLHAAKKLSQSPETTVIHSVNEGVEKFVEMVRITALQASGGDVVKASQFIGESERLMEIVAESSSAKQALSALIGPQKR